MTAAQSEKFSRGVEVIVGAVVCDEKGRVLICQSPKWQDKWIIPGGHIEPGETIFEAVQRETAEEVGIKVTASRIINVGELINPPTFERLVHCIFLHVLCSTATPQVVLDNKELTDYKWLSPREALQYDLATESLKETITKLL